MADTAGLVSLALTICKGLLAYYNSVRDASADIHRTYEMIESLNSTLLSLAQTLKRTRLDPEAVQLVRGHIGLCQIGIHALEKKLGKLKLSSRDESWAKPLMNAKMRLLYPFKESTLAKTRELCTELKDNLSLALMALNLDTAATARLRLEDMQANTVEARSAIKHLDLGMSKVFRSVQNLESAVRSEEDIELLGWLSPLMGTFENKQQEIFGTAIRQDAGAQSLLQSEAFKAWLDGIGKSLWCTAPPGTGKTITASYIINNLLLEPTITQYGTAYIYFSYKEAEKQIPVNLISSIIQQLISQHPNSMSELRLLHERHRVHRTRPSIMECSNLLQTLLRSFPKVYIVVDAIDECSEQNEARWVFLAQLWRLRFKACLLFMSRPIPTLEKELQGSTRVYLSPDEDDIKNYLLQRLDVTTTMKRHFRDEPSLRTTIVARITQKIKGMFLMARLYLDSIATKITRRKIKSALEALPDGLDGIYDETMRRIRQDNPPDHAELAIKVLAWTFLAFRPLKVQELQHALAVENGDSSLDEAGIPDRDFMISICAGMVEINQESDTVSLVHYTAQEYFDRHQEILFEPIKSNIAQTCLTYLSFDAFQDNATQSTTLRARDLTHDHPFLSYVAQHWGDHVREIEDPYVVESAVQLLKNEVIVDLAVLLKDLEDRKTKGEYLNPRNGLNGLSLAALFGLCNVAKLLINGGLDVRARDSNGQNALYHAISNGHVDTAKLIIDHKAPINQKDNRGWTVLHRAAADGQSELVDMLIQEGIDLDNTDGYNATALYRASENGAAKVAEILLKNNANVHIKNSYSQTALHRAADCGHKTIVQQLLDYGADIDAKDHYGYTAFYRAADQYHEEIKLLLHRYKQKK